MNETISLNKFFKLYVGKGKKIYWIKSPLTFRRWIERDINTNNILGAKTIPSNGGKTGLRYIIPINNIDLFISEYLNGTLYEKNNKANRKST